MVDPVLSAALAVDGVYFFAAMKIALPGKNLCLLDGAGQITIGADTYVGQDPDFGAISAIDSISDKDGEEAPELSLTMFPSSAASAATLANANMQGSIVQIICGVMDPATGLPVGTPEVKFLGEIDTVTLSVSEGRRELEFTIVSVFERLFEVDEGVRASDGWHQSIWPGELGLQYMTGTDKNLYWGGKRPAGQLAGSGFSNGGGSFGGGARTLNNVNAV